MLELFDRLFGKKEHPKLNLGDRLKQIESNYTGEDHDFPEALPRYNGFTLVPGGLFPVIRVDGHCFHTFTRKLQKPFDRSMERAMRDAMEELVKFFQAKVAYTQSDEITVVLPDTTQAFSRKTHKLASLAASVASVAFVTSMERQQPGFLERYEGKLPVFDGRCFGLTRPEVSDCIVWRQRDCIRNAVSAAAQSKFSHKQLLGKNTDDKVAMLAESGIDMWNDYGPNSVFGTFARRRVYQVVLTEAEISELPEKHNLRTGGSNTCVRSEIQRIASPRLSTVNNLDAFLFDGEDFREAVMK